MFINLYCILILSVVEIVPIVITRDSSVEKLASPCLYHAPGFIRCVWLCGCVTVVSGDVLVLKSKNPDNI